MMKKKDVKKIKAIIVDDEEPARSRMCLLLKQYSDIEIIAECGNAVEALQTIKLKPDVIFLDIRMPKITGLEFASMIDLDSPESPRIVFVTAYDEYAIKAFENNAIDYLLKPVEEERLTSTVQRIRADRQPPNLDPVLLDELQLIPCFKGANSYLINSNEIIYVQSKADEGTDLITEKETYPYHTNLSLKSLEERSKLTRCHNQYLINTDYIKIIKKNACGGEIQTKIEEHVVPISRRCMDKFF